MSSPKISTVPELVSARYDVRVGLGFRGARDSGLRSGGLRLGVAREKDEARTVSAPPSVVALVISSSASEDCMSGTGDGVLSTAGEDGELRSLVTPSGGTGVMETSSCDIPMSAEAGDVTPALVATRKGIFCVTSLETVTRGRLKAGRVVTSTASPSVESPIAGLLTDDVTPSLVTDPGRLKIAVPAAGLNSRLDVR